MQHFRIRVRLMQWLNKKLGLTDARGLLWFSEPLLTIHLPYWWLCGRLLKLGLPLAAEILTAIWLQLFH